VPSVSPTRFEERQALLDRIFAEDVARQAKNPDAAEVAKDGQEVNLTDSPSGSMPLT
jgi:hypothetical protein